MTHDIRHIPVLPTQVIEALHPRPGTPGQIFVDCTLGLGGHSALILQSLLATTKKTRPTAALPPPSRLLGIDFDPANIEIARQKLQAVLTRSTGVPPVVVSTGGTPVPRSPKGEKKRSTPPATPPATFELFHNNFAALPTVLAQAGLDQADGILADLGVASPQIDDPARGFSYRRPGPLDMRMDPTRGQPASAYLNRMSEAELAAALLELGDETDAPRIARLIVHRRALKPISTTQELMALVCQARDFTIARAGGAKLHPAARTFQALRILVNRELANLDRLLTVLPSCLKPGGTAVIISFHSGEDRRVKAAFKDAYRAGIYAAISPDVIIADAAEQLANPRSRSAKLRWARMP